MEAYHGRGSQAYSGLSLSRLPPERGGGAQRIPAGGVRQRTALPLRQILPPGGADGRPGEAHRPLPVLRQGSHRHLLLPRLSPREGTGLLLRRLGAGLLLRGGGGAGVCRPPAPGGSGGQAGGRFRGEGGLPGRAGDAGGALRAQGDRPAGPFGSRQEEVSTISRSLKGLAKELNIPIIALSQLNRGVENREGEEGKRPQLSDLRESGAIEQDADMVCFIHRPEYYKIYTSADGSDLRGMAEIIIAKHRNGAVGDVRLRFIGQYTRFQNPEDDMVIPPPTEGGGATFGSRMNAPIGSTATPPPPSAADFPPQTDNPFGGVGSDGPLPF